MRGRRTTQEKLRIFAASFRGRSDIHGTRDRMTGRARCVKAPTTTERLLKHLHGKRPIGIYPLVKDHVWFATIDIDEPDPKFVLDLHGLATSVGMSPLVERSKSKGWHLWFFADDVGWDAVTARRVLKWMTGEVNRPELEIFPKQDRLSTQGFGNFIFLPLDGALVPKGRAILVEPERWMPPVQDPWKTLVERPQYSQQHLLQIIASVGLERATTTGNRRPYEENEICNESSLCPSDDDAKGSHDRQSKISCSSWGLPPCARRMLDEGVTEHQRVSCFRLAVHLHRLGFPEDMAFEMLVRWAKKNRPVNGNRVITREEIEQQTRDGYSGRYRGYGCEDPMIARYCGDACPFRKQ